MVLRRGGRGEDQRAVRVLHQHRLVEGGRLLQDRIGLIAQEVLVPCEFVVLPQVPAQPAAGHRPEGEHRAALPVRAHRGGHAPEVGVVVADEAGRAVILAGGALAALGQLAQQALHRLEAFGQVHPVGRPVVHLGIDVDGVVAVPRREDQVVPQALERGRLSALAAGGNGQVSAIVEQQRIERQILLAVLVPVEPLVGGQQLFVSAAQIQRHAVVKRAVILYVPLPKLLIAALRRGLQILQAGLDILLPLQNGVLVPAIEAGAHGEEDGRAVRALDLDAPAALGDLAALAQHARHRQIADSPLGVVLSVLERLFKVPIDRVAPDIGRAVSLDRLIVLPAAHRRAKGGRQAHLKAHAARPISRQAHDQHLIRRADKQLAPVRDAARPVADLMNALVQRQLPPIIAHRFPVAHGQQQIAQRQIHLGPQPGKALLEHPLCLGIFALERKSLRLFIGLSRPGRLAVARPSRPQRVLIETHPLTYRAAEGHRANAAVAERQRLVPSARLLPIPQAIRSIVFHGFPSPLCSHYITRFAG